MTVPHAEHLVVDYLARLERAAGMLPPGDRADLIDGIREHIDTALATGTVSDEAGMRTLLDRLGEPEAIAASARENNDPGPDLHVGAPTESPSSRTGPTSSWGGLEIAVVLLLGVGAFVVPVIGPLVGLILLQSSTQWTPRQKRIGTAIAVLPVLLGVAVVVLFLLLRGLL
jgi:uncharacterized membrane protein